LPSSLRTVSTARAAADSGAGAGRGAGAGATAAATRTDGGAAWRGAATRAAAGADGAAGSAGADDAAEAAVTMTTISASMGFGAWAASARTDIDSPGDTFGGECAAADVTKPSKPNPSSARIARVENPHRIEICPPLFGIQATASFGRADLDVPFRRGDAPNQRSNRYCFVRLPTRRHRPKRRVLARERTAPARTTLPMGLAYSAVWAPPPIMHEDNSPSADFGATRERFREHIRTHSPRSSRTPNRAAEQLRLTRVHLSTKVAP
jgi:hypothetical protein